MPPRLLRITSQDIVHPSILLFSIQFHCSVVHKVLTVHNHEFHSTNPKWKVIVGEFFSKRIDSRFGWSICDIVISRNAHQFFIRMEILEILFERDYLFWSDRCTRHSIDQITTDDDEPWSGFHFIHDFDKSLDQPGFRINLRMLDIFFL